MGGKGRSELDRGTLGDDCVRESEDDGSTEHSEGVVKGDEYTEGVVKGDGSTEHSEGVVSEEEVEGADNAVAAGEVVVSREGEKNDTAGAASGKM